MVLRAFTTLGEWVLIFIHSSTGCEQAGARSAMPSTSTTHMRQAPVGVNPSMKHSVGTLIPLRDSVCRMVSPCLARMVLLLTSISKIMISCFSGAYLIKIALNLHTS